MVKGKVVSLVTLAGEYIGKFIDDANGNVILENPRMLVNTPDGKVGFARGICMTGTENPKQGMFYAGGVVIVTETNPEFAAAYTEAVTGLAVPTGKVII
jgi:hypothetical protein|tara:strand:+ start:538 stop:834 length:297 start_codon:yes stop_codon:yes gene_type:complete